MDLEEAVRLWVNRDFSNVPGSLVERAFKENPEDLEMLAGGERVSDCCDEPATDKRPKEDQCACCEGDMHEGPEDADPHWIVVIRDGRIFCSDECADIGAGDDDITHWCTSCDKPCETHWSGAQHAWPAAWGTMFIPNDSGDEHWIRDNAETVAECGFIVYESDETGIILGIDGAGYDFYADHWTPLYHARNLKWHKPVEERTPEQA